MKQFSYHHWYCFHLYVTIIINFIICGGTTMIFQIDKTIYEQLSETERYIVDFIIQNENKISYLSITNIADKTFSSPATVSRTIQKCGFKGIAELRYLISKEDKDKSKNVS